MTTAADKAFNADYTASQEEIAGILEVMSKLAYTKDIKMPNKFWQGNNRNLGNFECPNVKIYILEYSRKHCLLAVKVGRKYMQQYRLPISQLKKAHRLYNNACNCWMFSLQLPESILESYKDGYKPSRLGEVQFLLFCDNTIDTIEPDTLELVSKYHKEGNYVSIHKIDTNKYIARYYSIIGNRESVCYQYYLTESNLKQAQSMYESVIAS